MALQEGVEVAFNNIISTCGWEKVKHMCSQSQGKQLLDKAKD